MVEALERGPSHLDDSDEATGLRVLLEDRDAHSFPEEAIRRDEPGETAADDGDARGRGVHAPSLALRRGRVVLP